MRRPRLMHDEKAFVHSKFLEQSRSLLASEIKKNQ
jgi:hypothetical protein